VIREVLRTDPRLGAEPRGFAWWLSILVCKPILLVLRRPDWRGVEYVPRAGGAVLAANHVSHIDPLLVAEMILAQRRVPRFLAKDSLFAVPLVGWWFRSAGHVEVDRTAGQAGYRSAVEAVARGQLILVYPEGSITKREDGLPMAMKSGAVRIALAASVPLLPVAQWGAQEILPPYSGRLRLGWRRPVSLVVGPPVPLDDLHELGETWAVKEGCRRLEAAITAMVDQLAGVPADR
jgi:1-acyl-sn-glycerol-3-phosphate acyltransferase